MANVSYNVVVKTFKTMRRIWFKDVRSVHKTYCH